ncbi:MAG: CYTH domain-containing protein [Bacillota bacterium]
MEVEIKLHVDPRIPGGPEALFERLASLDRLAGQTVGSARRVRLRDVYYDTPGGHLAAARAGLRLRVEDGAAFVTLKLSRRQEGALTTREEHEYPLDGDALVRVLERIHPLVEVGSVSVGAFAEGRPTGGLIPVLDVVTDRTIRPIASIGSLVLDRVWYPGLSGACFFDIEVEAGTGPGEEAGLRQVERQLRAEARSYLAQAELSKLERGCG